MKKLIYNSGIIITLIVLTGSLFKIQHWPGAGVLLTLGLGSLILFLIPAALINNYKAVGSRNKLLLYIVVFIVSLLVYGGALFKIMHWPGAGKLLIIGIPLPFFVFVPVFLYSISKDKSFSIIQTTIVLLFVAYMGVSSALLALGYSKNILTEGAMMEKQLATTALNLDRINELKAVEMNQVRGIEKQQYDFVAVRMKGGMAAVLENAENETLKAVEPSYAAQMSRKDDFESVALTVLEESNQNRLSSILKSLDKSGREEEFYFDEVGKLFNNTPAVFAFPLLSDLEIMILMKEKEQLDSKLILKYP